MKGWINFQHFNIVDLAVIYGRQFKLIKCY
jgi:hypothetical protein